MTELFPPIEALPIDDLPAFLGSSEPLNYPESSREKSFHDWKMETDDAPIFRYIYRNFAPRRHLEFGTWKGEGTCYVLEESAATVWTLNAPLGERDADGAGAYGAYPEEVPEITEWIEGLGLKLGDRIQSDTVAMIGRKYLARNLGSRVCQIYSDSREWDVTNYPAGFFDTVLIDGGHDADVVLNDTRKALRLVRSGGLVMWHDFCPDDEIVRDFSTCAGVVNAIRDMSGEFAGLSRLVWIEPSFILLGVKA